MSLLTREIVIENIEKDLAFARATAQEAREYALECAKNNSISGSGERLIAEGQSVAWDETVTRLKKLRLTLDGEVANRISLGSLAEIEMDDDKFTAIVSEVNCRLSNSDIIVVTPQSPIGKVLIGRGQGETIEYQIGSDKIRARIQKIF